MIYSILKKSKEYQNMVIVEATLNIVFIGVCANTTIHVWDRFSKNFYKSPFDENTKKLVDENIKNINIASEIQKFKYIPSHQFINKDLNFDINAYDKFIEKCATFNHIAYFDYFLTKSDPYYEIFKNIFETIKYHGGTCTGMCLCFLKDNNVDFSNGPNLDSIIYQYMHPTFLEIKNTNLNKLNLNIISVKNCKPNELTNGSYLVICYSIGNCHAVVIMKSDNETTYFDPNVGVIKYDENSDISVTFDKYLLYIAYEIEQLH